MLKKLLSLSLATAMCIAGTASTCVTAATDIMSVDEENTAYTVGMNGITSNISDEVNDDPVEQLRRLYPDDCTNIIILYNTPLRFAFTEYSNIDDVLTGKELLAKYYAVEHNDGSFTFFNEDLKELKSNSYTEIDGKTVELPFINMPEGAVNAYKNSDFAKECISPDAVIESVYYLSGENSMMGTAVYYKTSVGDYVYYYYHTIGEMLFPLDDFCDFQQAISDEYAKNPDADGGIDIAGVWDLSDYMLRDVNDDPVEQLRRLYPDDCTNIISVYNTPLRFAFTEYSNIDGVLTGKELLAKYYAVEHKDGSFTFFNENLKELKSNSYTEINGKTVELPFINMPEGAVNAYKNSDFAKKYISPNAEIESVYYLSSESSMMGTAVYYKTSVGDYVYFVHYDIGSALFPITDFCKYQQAINDEISKHPDLDAGDLNIAGIWDLSEYELQAITSGIMGDVNNDGAFNVSDVVLLQKWLLAVPDTHLANWKAVDFCEDNKLNVFDLCLMKRALIEKMNNEPQNVDISFKFKSVTDIRYNDDNHTKWTGFVARSENDLINILAENEGVSADKASIEGIDSNTLPKQTEYIAGIYLRLSKDDERNGESLSIENQRRILTDYVKEQGWTLYDEYVDDGISGVSFDRPGVQRMLDDAKNGKINLIICKDMSRFGRNYIQVGQYVDYIFPSYNIRFIALNDSIDTANADSASMDMLPIMNIFNEWHAANTSKKLKAVIASGAKAGKYKTPNPSYGYLKGDDEFCTPVVDPYAADVVRRIFEMRAKGMSLLQICGVLNEEKILLPSDYRYQRTGQVNKTTNDHLWGIGNVKCILNNEMYLGHLCQLKTTTVSYKNHKVIRKGKEDWVIIENNHEPIISQELWDKVREYEKSVSRGKMTKSRVTVPLSGLMYCQDCGNKMRVHSGAGENKMLTGYTCGLHSRCGKGCCSSHYIREYIMEEIVLNDIKAMIDLTIDEDAAKQMFLAKRSGMHDTQSAEDSKRIAYVKDRLTELDRMIVKVYEDNVNGKVPDEVCKTLLEKYQAEKTSLQAEQAELEKRMETAMQDEQDVEEFIRRLKKYAGAEDLTREMCLDLIEYVTVDEYVKDRTKPRKIHVYYKFLDEGLKDKRNALVQ